MIDLVEMKGIRFMDETMGAQFETLGIPEEIRTRCSMRASG